MIWKLLRPVLFLLPAESAHHFAMSCFCASMGVRPLARWTERRLRVVDPRLEVNAFGLRFPNPVGLAAGFDKHARWYPALARLGFGSLEVGTLTAQAQAGNPRPRLFRLAHDQALINRMGFNNCGAPDAAARLRHRPKPDLVLGINIGKSKSAGLEAAADDYAASFRALFSFADYVAINVSSPNTPGLRDLQQRSSLAELLAALQRENRRLARDNSTTPRPLLLKIAPDLDPSQLIDVLNVAMEQQVCGLIATNTTTRRDGLRSAAGLVARAGEGGLSGRPIAQRAREVVRMAFAHTQGKLPIVGVGGIFSGEDAWNMIGAGASLVQIYTGLVYRGPGLVAQINRALLARLGQHNLTSISQAVGRDV